MDDFIHGLHSWRGAKWSEARQRQQESWQRTFGLSSTCKWKKSSCTLPRLVLSDWCVLVFVHTWTKNCSWVLHKQKYSCMKKEKNNWNHIPYLNRSWMKGFGAVINFVSSTGSQNTTLWFESTGVPSLPGQATTYFGGYKNQEPDSSRRLIWSTFSKKKLSYNSGDTRYIWVLLQF
jgi:hypothetical protein